jgi:tetratricopeptide (TPR) repeat protein
MKFLGVVHSSAQKAGPFLAPFLELRTLEGLGGATPDVIVADFASLASDDLQQILKFLPQQPLFVHTGAAERRPVFATHNLHPEAPPDGLKWEAGKVYLDAAARRAATSPFNLETFFTDLFTLPSGLLGLRKGGHDFLFYFRDGQVVYLRNSDASLSLGRLLVQSGVCDQAALDAALKEQEATGLPLGQCLERMPAASHDQVRKALKEQAGLMMQKMASSGMAVELKMAFPLPTGIWEPLPVQRVELLSAFLHSLPRWPGEVPLCVHPETEVQAADRPEAFTALALNPGQYFLLQQAAAALPLRTLYSLTPGALFDKEKDVFLLAVAGALKVVKSAKRLNPFDEAVEMAKGLSKLTLYQVLGVKEDATPVQIRTAYFDLAKRFHPDKFSRYPDFSKYAKMLEDLFATINEAYQILGDPEEKAKYNRRIQEGKTLTVDVNEKARTLTAEARAAIQQKQFGTAIQKLNEVVYLKKADAKTYLYLGQCFLKDADKVKDAEAAIKKSMDMEPNDAEAHYLLGMVYLQARLKGRAVKSFQRALELNPAHLDADQQIKALE